MLFSVFNTLATQVPNIYEVAEGYEDSPIELINIGIAYALIVSMFLTVFFIFFGGITFILSGGQEDKIKQAISTIRYAIIGFIITMLSVVIVGTVGKAFGLNVMEYLQPSQLIELVGNILDFNSSPSYSGGNSINSLD